VPCWQPVILSAEGLDRWTSSTLCSDPRVPLNDSEDPWIRAELHPESGR